MTRSDLLFNKIILAAAMRTDYREQERKQGDQKSGKRGPNLPGIVKAEDDAGLDLALAQGR